MVAMLLLGRPLACALHARGRRSRPDAPDRPCRLVNTLKDAFAKLGACRRPRPRSVANPMDIAVIVSFNRASEIPGRPG
jgi:hypothetical protein